MSKQKADMTENIVVFLFAAFFSFLSFVGVTHWHVSEEWEKAGIIVMFIISAFLWVILGAGIALSLAYTPPEDDEQKPTQKDQ